MNKKFFAALAIISTIYIIGSLHSGISNVPQKELVKTGELDGLNLIFAPNVIEPTADNVGSIFMPVYTPSSDRTRQSSLQNQREVVIRNRYICQ